MPTPLGSPLVRFCRNLVEIELRPPGRSLFSSFLLHGATLLFFISLPPGVFSVPMNRASRIAEPANVVYQLSLVDLARPNAPVVLIFPVGRAKHQSDERGQKLKPLAGNIGVHPQLAVVSRPAHPDNLRHTVVQPVRTPEQENVERLKLPILLLGKLFEEAKPPANRAASEPAGVPLPPMPSAPLAQRAAEPFRALETQAQPASAAARVAVADEVESPTSTAPALLTLSPQPANIQDVLSLPRGNRFGEFAGMPAGGAPPIPGSARNGTGAAVGEANSSHVPTNAAPINFAEPASLVFPVLASNIHLRALGVVVSTGAAGGGGLGVYGVLRCGTIYTIYLAMPGKRWVLEYCAHRAPVPDAAADTGHVGVHLDEVVAAPAVEERFDFHRPRLPAEDAGKQIVLHGFIREDGSVGELEVLRGVEPVTDAAARAAFSRWRFFPTRRAGKPVALEVLAGIPATLPERLISP